jgi:hypothetical protein
MESPDALGSEHWINAYKKTAFNYLHFVKSKPGGSLVTLQDKQFDEIRSDYRSSVIKYKEDIKGTNFSDVRIDHHKIIAFYIRTFLRNPPFFYDKPDVPGDESRSWFAMLPNEYFCIVLIELILLGWNNDKSKRLFLPDQYRRHLIILFHQYLQKTGNNRDYFFIAYNLFVARV